MLWCVACRKTRSSSCTEMKRVLQGRDPAVQVTWMLSLQDCWSVSDREALKATGTRYYILENGTQTERGANSAAISRENLAFSGRDLPSGVVAYGTHSTAYPELLTYTDRSGSQGIYAWTLQNLAMVLFTNNNIKVSLVYRLHQHSGHHDSTLPQAPPPTNE